MAVDKLSNIDDSDNPRGSSHFKQKDKGNGLNKNGKGQVAEKEDEYGKT